MRPQKESALGLSWPVVSQGLHRTALYRYFLSCGSGRLVCSIVQQGFNSSLHQSMRPPPQLAIESGLADEGAQAL